MNKSHKNKSHAIFRLANVVVSFLHIKRDLISGRIFSNIMKVKGDMAMNLEITK